MNRHDIQVLRIPLIILASSLLVAVACVYFSGKVHDAARERLATREHALKQARLRIQHAHEESELITRYLTSYQQLMATGFIGDEQRMNWLDGLRIANDQARLFGVEYDIGVQRPYSYASELNVGALVLQESIMNLRFRLLHEEDLPRFFDFLTKTAAGLYTIDQCKLQRLKDIQTEEVVQPPNLAAECALRWLTVRPSPLPEKPR
ncbi:MAG: hypothetical protein V4637_16065 [Pseudomonadota bacterium]